MTYTLNFLSEVEEDVVNGYAWYENKSPGVRDPRTIRLKLYARKEKP